MMSRFNQPARLKNLALNSFSEFVKGLSIELLNSEAAITRGSSSTTLHYEERETGCFQNIFKAMVSSIRRMFLFSNHNQNLEPVVSPRNSVSQLQQICNHLQDMLHSMMIPILANELTASLLEVLCKLINNMTGLTDKPWSETVMQDLVTSVIHPSVTKLKLTYQLHYIVPMVCVTLNTMTNLKELELLFVSDISDLRMLVSVIDEQLEHFVVTGLQSLVNLETFRFPCNCTDNIVISVGKSCRYLKRLDFRCSKVTDISLQSILNLQYLIELNLSRTNISEEGCSQLLIRMVQNNVMLKSFGCSSISVFQLDILVNKFSALTQVNLVSFDCDLSLLKELKNLRALRLQSGCFSHVEDVLLSSSKHLLILELARIVGVNIQLIGENCLNLDSLTLRCCSTKVPESNPFDDPLPGFSNLQHVAIHTKSDSSLVTYVLSQSLNVKFVSVVSITGMDDVCIENILEKNQFNCLEELYLEMHGGQLSLSAARKIIGHSLKLTLLKGIKTWESDNDALDEFLQEISLAYPGVRIL